MFLHNRFPTKVIAFFFLLMGLGQLDAQPSTLEATVLELQQAPIRDVEADGDRLYQARQYAEAYPYYKALQKMNKRFGSEEQYRLGKTALYAKQYDESSKQLREILPKAKKYPLIQYEYALALKYTGEYILANQHFQSFLNDDAAALPSSYTKLAQVHLQSCQKILKEREKTSNWSLGYFADADAAETTIYRGRTPMSKYNIALIECQTPEGICIKKVYPDNRIELLRGTVGNPVFNSSAPHIAPDGETVYFAQQELGQPEHHIFVGKLAANGEIIDIRKLGPTINRVGYSSTHPTIGRTERGQEILYFASTLPGTQGGYDIWYAIKTIEGEFTQAYNLGTRINGHGDEVTPFYYQEDGQLYFSSEKPQGYGGLDVYRMTGEKRRWEEIQAEQLPNPVNSKANEYYFKKYSAAEGSFTTDRKDKKEQTVKYKENIGA